MLQGEDSLLLLLATLLRRVDLRHGDGIVGLLILGGVGRAVSVCDGVALGSAVVVESVDLRRLHSLIERAALVAGSVLV